MQTVMTVYVGVFKSYLTTFSKYKNIKIEVLSKVVHFLVDA